MQCTDLDSTHYQASLLVKRQKSVVIFDNFRFIRVNLGKSLVDLSNWWTTNYVLLGPVEPEISNRKKSILKNAKSIPKIAGITADISAESWQHSRLLLVHRNLLQDQTCL